MHLYTPEPCSHRKTSKGYFLSQCLVKSQLFTGTGRFLDGLFTFLRWPPVVIWLRTNGKNCSELSPWLWKNQVRVFCVVFHGMMLRCKIWSVPHMNEGRETSISSNAARKWGRQWATADLVLCHPPLPGSCQSWSILTTSFTPWHQRDRDWARGRDCFRAFN